MVRWSVDARSRGCGDEDGAASGLSPQGTPRGRSSEWSGEEEEEYDYAIELKRDEQYRQVAEQQMPAARDDIVLDASHDIENNFGRDSLEQDNGNIENADTHMNFIMSLAEDGDSDEEESNGHGEGGGDQSNDIVPREEEEAFKTGSMQRGGGGAAGVVSIAQYRQSMVGLQRRQRRATTAARRSTSAFQTKYCSTDRELINRFLIALQRGVNVKRHEAGKSAQTVRLFTLTGSKSIQWGPEVVLQGMGHYLHRGSQRDIFKGAKLSSDSSGFDCCITG